MIPQQGKPMMKDYPETHAWRVRLRITTERQLEKLTPALFQMKGIGETWPNMEIIFRMTDFAIFMAACSKLEGQIDITKLDIEIVDLKEEPQRVFVQHNTPRPITKLRHSKD
jgi:hypothetical protein